MMKIFLLILSSMTLFLTSLQTVAGNYDFLDETAGQYFTDQDWQLFLDAQNKALNHYSDGSKLIWKNSENGHWGSFVPSRTTKNKGILCRALTIDNYANHRTGQSTLTFCKENNVWKGI